MDSFSKIESPLLRDRQCRLIWNVERDDQHAVLLNKEEIKQLVDILKNNNTGKVDLGDNFNKILINSDVTQFQLKNRSHLETQTVKLREHVLDYARVAHDPLYVQVVSKEFQPSVLVHKYDGKYMDSAK